MAVATRAAAIAAAAATSIGAATDSVFPRVLPSLLPRVLAFMLLLISLQILVSLDSEKYNILSVQHILSDFVPPRIVTGLRSL